MKAILNGTILTPQAELIDKVLLFDERIVDIVDASFPITGVEIIDAQGKYVSPGLVDVHIHGYVGEDASDGSEEGVRKIAKALLANGVTSFLPTTATISSDEILIAFDIIRKLMHESTQKQFDGSQILVVMPKVRSSIPIKRSAGGREISCRQMPKPSSRTKI